MKINRNPKYVKQYRDRAGNWINQYRRGGKLIRLPDGRNFTEAWWEAYYEAERQFLAGEMLGKVGETRTRSGSIDAALVGYYKSIGFLGLAPKSRETFRHHLEHNFRPIVGNALLAHLKTSHINELISEKFATAPAGSRVLASAIRSFTKFCVADERIKTDPAIGVKTPKVVNTEGYHTWTEEQIEQYRSTHPIGGFARLAFELHFNTAQRTGDVMRMGRQHVGRDGMIRITQKKRGAKVAIPIDDDLQPILNAVPPTDELIFLFAAHGKRFAQNTYNEWWRKWVAEAGLPKECVPHGLRKAALTRLAEAGANVQELKAVGGHKHLKDVDHYTAKVDLEHMSRQAFNRLKTRTKVSSQTITLDKMGV